MKRVGGLWPELTSFANLLAAAEAAASCKRGRWDVAAFRMNQEWELMRLQRELLDGSYAPGDYHEFKVLDPKPRVISAARFRDRVVHHALTRVLEPIFERRFSKDSYACRKGLGTHRALEVAKLGVRECRYVLKCDVRKYFASIDHQILREKLERVVKCGPTLDLAAKIMAGFKQREDHVVYFPGDNLFTPHERRRGLPLGNQTSQFFANVYLDRLDQRMAREWRPVLYARYVDDLVAFHDDKLALTDLRAAMVEELDSVRLLLHAGKSRVYRCSEGLTFLGWRLFPWRFRLARGNAIGFGRRLRAMRDAHAAGKLDMRAVNASVAAWIGHARNGHTLGLRRRLFSRYGFRKRHRV